MKKKVFITGFSSSIMQKLICLINLQEYKIIGLSRKLVSQNLENITIIQGDLLAPKTYINYLIDCDIIIHGAAITHSFDEKKYYKINYNITKQLVDKAKEFNISTFVFISSNTASTENGAYASSKFLAEKYIKNELANWQIFRISEIFGAIKNEGIEKLIENSFKNKYILCPKNVPYKFSPIFIEDAVRMIYKNIFIEAKKNKIININGNEKFTFKEIVSYIKKIKPKPLIEMSISRNIMFLIMYVSAKIPFYIGIIPDQIKRLYGIKTYGITNEEEITLRFNDYINKIMKKN